MCKNLMTHAQIKKVTSKMADENFAKDTFQSFVRKTVLTDFFFYKKWTDFLGEAVCISSVEKNGIQVFALDLLLEQDLPE